MTLVAVLVIGGLPNAPALADPCAATTAPTGIGNRVCHDGRTISEADGVVRDVYADTFAEVTFVTFRVDRGFDIDERAIVSRGGDEWSAHMATGGMLGLRALDQFGWPLDANTDAGRYRLVHLMTPMLTEWRDAFAANAVTVHAYVPTNHFVVRLPAGADDATLHFPFVDGIYQVPTQAKVEPGLILDDGLRKVNILYWPGAEGAREATLGALTALDAVVTQDAPDIERIQAWVHASDIPALAAVPDVMWIDRAGEADAELDMDKIRAMVGADYLVTPPLGFDGTGIVGQVMDSELDLNHPDFQASLLVDYSAPQSPAGTHGSSVYGIVFGDGTGDSLATGMAPGAKATFAQYLSDTRYSYAEQMVNDYGGVMQTHSWGNAVPKDNTYDSYSNENDRVVLDLDVLMLQSMSNCGPQCARREAMAKNILSIGAVYHRDTTDLLDDDWNGGGGSMASTGPAADGRIKPDLVGPYDLIRTTTRGGYTTGFGGTSGATPVVAGSVILTNQMYNEGVFAGSAGLPEPSTVKALLIASGHTYNPDQMQTPPNANPKTWLAEPYKRDVQGWGLPDLQALHDSGNGALVVDGTVALESGEAHTVTFTPPAGATQVRISLVWTDVPANPGASTTLINDLDLAVMDPTGTLGLFLGNFGLDQSTVSLPGGLRDELNNVENVFLPAVEGVPLTISVTGTAVNMDADPSTAEVDQPFSLVVLSLA